jgi:hypothetical protein
VNKLVGGVARIVDGVDTANDVRAGVDPFEGIINLDKAFDFNPETLRGFHKVPPHPANGMPSPTGTSSTPKALDSTETPTITLHQFAILYLIKTKLGIALHSITHLITTFTGLKLPGIFNL